MQYRNIKDSLLSGNDTVPIINLGNHGYADSFFPANMRSEAAESIPLICRLDKKSGLVQLENISNANDRYSLVDYSYTSSNSKISKLHWNEYASFLNKKIGLLNARILEVGSNDGYLLEQLKKYTTNILGVDASPTMTSYANSKNIATINGVFGESVELSENIKDYYKEFDLIIANNVLNHSNNPVNFLKSVASHLSSEGIFVFEVPYWLSTIKSFRFDQIYLEHITYFTVESISNLVEHAGLHIKDVVLVDYHGGSLRVLVCKNQIYSASKDRFMNSEKKYALKNEDTYLNYMQNINNARSNFFARLEKAATSNSQSTIFGIGAAAKANTLLTYYGFNNQRMKFIVDSSIFKQGKITPVTLIPILPDNEVKIISSGIGVVLAWNLSATLKSNLLKLNPKLIFVDTLA
jgi:2-polyprenyl-3-methyl-5-hydroxy-6-metoxy-1,4-benzoquinol methylase